MRKLFPLFALLLIAVSTPAQTSTITWGTTHQTIDGFGVSDYQVNGGIVPALTSTQQQFLFSPTSGIGLDFLRIAVSQSSACTSVSSTCANDLTNGDGVNNISDAQACITYGCKVWASPWTPPAAYKTNSSLLCTSGATLTSGDYGAYATFLSNFTTSLETYFSIPLYALSVQNEPETCSNVIATSTLSESAYDTFIKTNLGPTFVLNNPGTLIMMPESSVYSDLTSYAGTCMGDSGCSTYVGIIATHSYASSLPTSPTNAYGVSHYWETEISDGSGYGVQTCSGGAWCNTIGDAITWAQSIHYFMAAGATAWHWWNTQQPSGYDSSANVGLYYSDQVTIAKRAYAIGNWSKFVRPGWVRIDSTTNPQTGVYVTAFKASDNSAYAIVAVNTNASTTNQPFNFSGFPTTTGGVVTPNLTCANGGAGCPSGGANLAAQSTVNIGSGSWSYVLPASSVTTFVGSTSYSITGTAGAPSAVINYSGTSSGSVTASATSPYSFTILGLSNGAYTLTPSLSGYTFSPTSASETISGANISGVSFAATPVATANACPTGANYLNPTGSPVTLGSLGVTTCYYVSAAGSDTNSGATKTLAWAHLPGMPTCTGSCAAHTPVAGEGYILRGGDTWGNANFGIYWNWGGTATNPIYVGVDSTWYAGVAWVRPIFNLGGAVAPTTSGAAGNRFLFMNGPAKSYITFDNFEMTGWHQSGGIWTGLVFLSSPYQVIENCYFHGWTVATTETLDGSTWVSGYAGGGTTNLVGTTVRYSIFDGGDAVTRNLFTNTLCTTPVASGGWGLSVTPCGMGDGVGYVDNVYGNVFNYLVVGAHAALSNVHDNLIENITYSFQVSGSSNHPDAIFMLGGPMPGATSLLYNNVVHDVVSGAQTFWMGQGSATSTGYLFNNVSWNAPGATGALEVGNHSSYGNLGTYDVFNNSVQVSGASCIANTDGQTTNWVANYSNIHCIGNSGATVPTICSPSGATCVNGGGNLAQSLTAANAQGYNDTGAFSWQPVVGGSTIGGGINDQSICTTITALNAAAGAACGDSTGYSCIYNTTNHTVICPALSLVARPTSSAWDIGAYQYSAGSLAPSVTYNPTGVTFGSISVGSSAPTQNVNLTNSGTGTLSILSQAISGTNATDFGFTTIPASLCGGSIMPGGNCTITFTFTPSVGGSESATFSMVDNASGSPHTIALTGTGVTSSAPNPSCVPGTSTYNQPPYPTVTCSDSAPVMCLTTNGTTPATNGTTGCTTGAIYNAPLSIGGTTTLNIIAGGTGYSDSSVITYVYTIQPAAVAPAAKIFAKVLVN